MPACTDNELIERMIRCEGYHVWPNEHIFHIAVAAIKPNSTKWRIANKKKPFLPFATFG